MNYEGLHESKGTNTFKSEVTDKAIYGDSLASDHFPPGSRCPCGPLLASPSRRSLNHPLQSSQGRAGGRPEQGGALWGRSESGPALPHAGLQYPSGAARRDETRA